MIPTIKCRKQQLPTMPFNRLASGDYFLKDGVLCLKTTHVYEDKYDGQKDFNYISLDSGLLRFASGHQEVTPVSAVSMEYDV